MTCFKPTINQQYNLQPASEVATITSARWLAKSAVLATAVHPWAAMWVCGTCTMRSQVWEYLLKTYPATFREVARKAGAPTFLAVRILALGDQICVCLHFGDARTRKNVIDLAFFVLYSYIGLRVTDSEYSWLTGYQLDLIARTVLSTAGLAPLP